MLYKVLEKSDYREFMEKMISDNHVVGPKKINNVMHDFVQVKNYDEIDTNYKKTTLSPAKKILFPPTEELVSYKFNEDIEVSSINKSEEKILFGISPWDLNGLNFLDKIFSTDFIDENYMEKREKLTVIGVDVDPSENNFAVKMKADYAKDGFDLFLSDLGDKYFVRVATEKGFELLNKYAKFKEASTDDFKAYDKFKNDYKNKFKSDVKIENFHNNFEAVYSDNELWDKISKNCFSCGSCNLVCPTCFCFNVTDDMKINLKEGIKSREWDSCMIPEYGLVAGGHNFRPSRSNRLKQRYRCKLKTFVDKFDVYSCVGCGRCTEACLAKINIVEDINAIKKEVSV